MILAAGLSPAWQQMMVLPRLHQGEVNRATEVHWCASGKVLNVGRALSSLGARQQTLAPLGGLAGQAIEREFAADRILSHWIWTASGTRVCTTLLEQGTQCVTELVENAAPMATSELEAFGQAYRALAAKAKVAVVSGSLPRGAPQAYYRELMEHATCPTILDARGPELLNALERRPLVVKPNRTELAATLGCDLSSNEDLLAGMRELVRRGAVWVLVSHGGGPVWLASTDALYRLSPPVIKVVNPIGSGDCLAAGLAYGLCEGLSVPEAACLGVAAAIENAQQLLPARLDPQRVLEQRKELHLERWA